MCLELAMTVTKIIFRKTKTLAYKMVICDEFTRSNIYSNFRGLRKEPPEVEVVYLQHRNYIHLRLKNKSANFTYFLNFL